MWSIRPPPSICAPSLTATLYRGGCEVCFRLVVMWEHVHSCSWSPWTTWGRPDIMNLNNIPWTSRVLASALGPGPVSPFASLPNLQYTSHLSLLPPRSNINTKPHIISTVELVDVIAPSRSVGGQGKVVLWRGGGAFGWSYWSGWGRATGVWGGCTGHVHICLISFRIMVWTQTVIAYLQPLDGSSWCLDHKDHKIHCCNCKEQPPP